MDVSVIPTLCMRKGVFKNLNNHSLHIDNLILIHQEKKNVFTTNQKTDIKFNTVIL